MKIENNKMVAWITGASSGIGKELAKQLSSKGWRLALTSRNLKNWGYDKILKVDLNAFLDNFLKSTLDHFFS